MKRLALLLGSLLVVTAAASAKEVVSAPVVVEEAPVQIVEKEVIVYRDKEEGFRPNGNIGLEYKYYGETEGQDYDLNETKDNGAWNGANKYSRLQLAGAVNMTENQRFEFRVRDYNDLQDASSNPVRPNQEKTGTETRLRYYYNHGLIGDSKVDLASRVEYFDYTDNDQRVEYQARFDFGAYLFDNDFIKTDYFIVAPKVGYRWGQGNDADYSQRYGFDIETKHLFPYGFDIELNIYNTYLAYGTSQGTAPDTYKDNIETDVELYLHYNANLYTQDKWSVDLGTEWGYDPYNAYNKRTHDRAYYLKADQWITATYQATEFVSVYGTLGAEYGNFVVTAEHDATNWRWQPYAALGFNVAF